jgi:hypothetical protein
MSSFTHPGPGACGIALDEFENRTLYFRNHEARRRLDIFPGRLAVAEVSQAIETDEIVASLPRRLHAIVERHVAETPDQVALEENGAAWSYRDLDRHVRDIARKLSPFGVRTSDRMMIVSQNCIALAGLLLAASRLDMPGRSWPIRAWPPERSIKFAITAARG